MNQYNILKVEEKFKGFLKVLCYTLKQKLANGEWSKEFSREIVSRGDAAAILIRDPATDTLLFTKQLRMGSIEKSPYIVELVAGMIDGKESPETTVIREAEEEAGVLGLKNIEFISSYYPSPGNCSEKISLFYGEADLSNVEGFGGCAEENEVIEIIKYSTSEALKQLKLGNLNTSINQISLFWLKNERSEGRKI